MTDALRTITERVRMRVRADGVDLATARGAERAYVREEIRRYSERALGGSQPLIADESGAEREILASLTGYGPLQPYLDDPEVEEIWIDAPDRVFVARAGVSELTGTVLTDVQVRDTVERMLQSSGRRVDLSSPFVDASLPDGSRLHVVIPDITRRHWVVNIRKFSRRIRSLDHLVELGSISRQAADFLAMCVSAGTNIVASGATHSGKTTLLNALLTAAPDTDRVVTAEETFELDADVRDLAAMQCRQPNLEGSGEVTLRRLVKEAMRMRPDRLVVGEVREAECLDLLVAFNAGVPGMTSVHANTAAEALSKLCTLPLLAGANIDARFVTPTVATCVDIVVHCRMDARGRRRVDEILAPTGRVTSGGDVEAVTLFGMHDGRLTATGALPVKTARFTDAGLDPATVLTAEAA